MNTADVYFADLRANFSRNLLDKVGELLTQAGAPQKISKGDLVAIKMHFGEKGNTGFIRPVFVRRVVETLKELGAKPFITDANTLYTGSRSDAVSHLETALANGFSYTSVGAPLIIADGLRGNSCIEVDVDGTHFKSVSIASEFANADAIVSLAHFKGHELSGFGGAIKNIGMGASARKGKMAQHSNVSPKVKKKKCVACGECLKWCSHGAISVGEAAFIDPDTCVGCGECIITCPVEAIQIRWTEGPQQMQEKMAEYTVGALAGKTDKSLFLNFVTQVSPACDCYGHTDAPIVADVGILSSADPVAIDQASVDLVNGCQGRDDSALKANHAPGEDKFRGVYPEIDWSVQLEHAQGLGLGSREYQLQRIDK